MTIFKVIATLVAGTLVLPLVLAVGWVLANLLATPPMWVLVPLAVLATLGTYGAVWEGLFGRKKA